jgi:hypothetical protein
LVKELEQYKELDPEAFVLKQKQSADLTSDINRWTGIILGSV